ncbi:MAG: hypothetical protein RJA34_1538 [Pseudomonadota bacterium]
MNAVQVVWVMAAFDPLQMFKGGMREDLLGGNIESGLVAHGKINRSYNKAKVMKFTAMCFQIAITIKTIPRKLKIIILMLIAETFNFFAQ